MRLVTYTHRGTTRLGAMLGDGQVVDLNRACACQRAERGEGRARVLADFLMPADMPAFLDAGDSAMEGARAALAWAETHVRAPRRGARGGALFDWTSRGCAWKPPSGGRARCSHPRLNYKSHAEEASSISRSDRSSSPSLLLHHRPGRAASTARGQHQARLRGRALP
jgi:hypothetical protein